MYGRIETESKAHSSPNSAILDAEINSAYLALNVTGTSAATNPLGRFAPYLTFIPEHGSLKRRKSD